MILKKASIIQTLWTLSVCAFTNRVEADPLSTIIELGLKQALPLKSQELKLQQSQNLRTNAYMSLLPVVSASAGKSYNIAEEVSDDTIQKTKSDPVTGKLSATWTIFDNFQNITNIRTAHLDLAAEELQSDIETQKYILSLLESFIDFQVLYVQRDITKAYLDQSQWVLGEASALVSAGAKARFEILDNEIQALNAQRDLREVEISLENSKRSLRNLLNANAAFEIPVVNLLELNPYYLNRINGTKISTLKAQVLEASHQTRDIRLANLNVSKSLIDLTQTKLDYFPKTTFQITHDINMDHVITKRNGPPYRGLNSTTYALQLSWQLWDWWITPNRIENSKLSHEILGFSFQDAKRKQDSEIHQLIEQYDIIDQGIESSNKVVQKSKQHLEYSMEMYRLGKLNNLAIQKATSNVYEAQLSLAQRLKQKYLLAAKLIYVNGDSLIPNLKKN